MPTFDLILLVPLLTAHFLSDFTFQPNAIVRNKGRPLVLLLHLLITGLCAYALLGDYREWRIPLLIIASHGIIDLAKAWLSPRPLRDLPALLLDQAAHIAVIFVISAFDWTTLGMVAPWWKGQNPASYLQVLVFIAGLIAVTQFAGIIIAKSLPKILETDPAELQAAVGLNRAGRYIGYLERILLFMFVLAGQLPAIGFLIAAKSVFRFQKANEKRKETEYILVGTLLSFTIGIALSFAAKALLPT